MLAIEIMHDHHRRLRRARDVIEVVEALLHVARLAERYPVLGLESDRLGVADDRRQVGERAVQMLDRIARAAALGRNDLDQIAHGRGVDRAEKVHLALRRRRHVVTCCSRRVFEEGGGD